MIDYIKLHEKHYTISKINTFNINSIELSKICTIIEFEYNYRDKIYGNTYSRYIIKILLENNKKIEILTQYSLKISRHQVLNNILKHFNINNDTFHKFKYNNKINVFYNEIKVKKSELKKLSI